MRESGLEPALPFLILNSSGDVLFVNARMKEMLSPGEESAPKNVKSLEKFWPFFNEFQGAPGFLGTVVKTPTKSGPVALYCEAYLKTFRIHVAEVKSNRVVVAELVRSGDLLEDVEARQVLFRSLSHEIRTAVMALMGYTHMLNDKCPEARLELEGVRNALSRLEGVVKRLDDFKAELKVMEDTKQSSKSEKKKK